MRERLRWRINNDLPDWVLVVTVGTAAAIIAAAAAYALIRYVIWGQ